MVAYLHNIFIEQGEDFEETIYFPWTIIVPCKTIGTRTAPLTRLTIDPIGAPIPSGFELHFSCDQKLITTAIAPAGQEFVLVQPYIGTIAEGAECDGPPADMTGTYEATIRDAFAGIILAHPVVTGSTNGNLVISIEDAVTSAIAFNIRRDEMPDGDPVELVQTPEDLGAALYAKGYPYQVRQTRGTKKTRVVEGVAFVAREVIHA